MKTRILFVDDDPFVLKGLERMLNGMREQWEMKFARGGQEALKLFEREPFDVVISDMCMPEMDGAQLLEQIKEKYPETVRIILTGHVDNPLTMQAFQFIHSFISKPCTTETLKSAVEQAFYLKKCQ